MEMRFNADGSLKLPENFAKRKQAAEPPKAQPALLGIIQSDMIDRIVEHFNEHERLTFQADASVGDAQIKSIYFRDAKKPKVTHKAELMHFSDKPDKNMIIEGKGNLFYTFTDLRKLSREIELSHLKHFNGGIVRNTAGTCVIEDPLAE